MSGIANSSNGFISWSLFGGCVRAVCCQCSPPFVGDGVRCTVDSDGDGYPDVALIDSPVCSDSEATQELFCIQVLVV